MKQAFWLADFFFIIGWLAIAFSEVSGFHIFLFLVPFILNFKKVKLRKKPISGRVRQNVLMRDDYSCQICGATVKDGAKLEIDHIIPVSKGGSNKEKNLQVLCQKCNREKHNRTDLLHDKRKLVELKGK